MEISFNRPDGTVLTVIPVDGEPFVFHLLLDGVPFNMHDKFVADYEAGLFEEKK